MEKKEGPEVIQDETSFTQLELDLFPRKSFWSYEDMKQIVWDVEDERHRQLAKWGIQSHENGTSAGWRHALKIARQENDAASEAGTSTWAWILLEEVYEALCETEFTGNLRAELVQAAAVIFAWIEDLDSPGPARNPGRQ